LTEPIKRFIKSFDAEISLKKALIERKGGKFFLINQNLKSLIEKSSGEYYYAGVFLGELKNKRFIPSLPLVFMIAEKARNKIFVNDKAAWLFICGRDIFKEGIVHAEGSIKRGNRTLIFNMHGECLGFGRIRQNLDEVKKGVAVENILDIGDFLRRERSRKD
jgi:ribosome biogenesis protein Nip4